MSSLAFCRMLSSLSSWAMSRDWGLGLADWASLLFYAWWRPINVLISRRRSVNFMIAAFSCGLPRSQRVRPKVKRSCRMGIVSNVAFLVYFMYMKFLRVCRDMMCRGRMFWNKSPPLGFFHNVSEDCVLITSRAAGYRVHAAGTCCLGAFLPES